MLLKTTVIVILCNQNYYGTSHNWNCKSQSARHHGWCITLYKYVRMCNGIEKWDATSKEQQQQQHTHNGTVLDSEKTSK